MQVDWKLWIGEGRGAEANMYIRTLWRLLQCRLHLAEDKEDCHVLVFVPLICSFNSRV